MNLSSYFIAASTVAIIVLIVIRSLQNAPPEQPPRSNRRARPGDELVFLAPKEPEQILPEQEKTEEDLESPEASL